MIDNEPYAPLRTYTPTIMDGPVIRWYRREWDVDNRTHPVVSASRNMVAVDASAVTTDQSVQLIEVIRDATLVMQMLQRGADVAHLANYPVRDVPAATAEAHVQRYPPS